MTEPTPSPLPHIRERQHHPESAGIPGTHMPPERDVWAPHKGAGGYELPSGEVVQGAEEARATLGAAPDEPEEDSTP